MEKMVELLLNAENVRMLLLMVFGYCGYVKLSTSFERRFNFLEKRIDGVEASILTLKNNDIAHLNYAIKALTFTLEKNKFLEKEDKEYVDGVLDG
ncbi:MAG: hypothetical protein LBC64_09470 [Fibromonadaceae bacterium]|jgi:hypothetical protein|nr:hypothetical protein [Fibromonadaceae bacterium]